MTDFICFLELFMDQLNFPDKVKIQDEIILPEMNKLLGSLVEYGILWQQVNLASRTLLFTERDYILVLVPRAIALNF